jgi:ribosomal protein S18 acetylase RimI-like enzyme
MEWMIRKARAADTPAVLEMIRRTTFFRPDEEAIAHEVLQQATTGDGSGYQSYVAESGGRVGGWVCFGATPCTLGTFDVYWIAVDPDKQKTGLGSRLLAFAEQRIAEQGGRLVVIETSGKNLYRPTQRFYEKNGYRRAACIEDFYATDDPKLIYTKAIT